MFEILAHEINAANGVLPVAVGHATAADHVNGEQFILNFTANYNILLHFLNADGQLTSPQAVKVTTPIAIDSEYKPLISADDGPMPPPR